MIWDRNWRKAWMCQPHGSLVRTRPRLQAQREPLTQAGEQAQPGKVADGSVFQEAFDGNVLFISWLNLPKFWIYPAVPQALKPGLVGPQEPILLSCTPRASLLEARLLTCYCRERTRRYHLLEVESTPQCNQCLLSPWATLLGVSRHTPKVAGWAGCQHKRN